MNEFCPYIGLRSTFHRRRVDRTSASGVGEPVSTLERVHSVGHRVELGSWDQGQRSNEEAS